VEVLVGVDRTWSSVRFLAKHLGSATLPPTMEGGGLWRSWLKSTEGG
jgi:hypothetical protein